MTTTPIYRRPHAERLAAVRPFIGRRCIVRYSPSRDRELVRETVGTVWGCARHVTNGTSTGELVIDTNGAGLEVVGLSTLVELEELHR